MRPDGSGPRMFAWAVSEGPGRPLLARSRCGARAIVEIKDGGDYATLKVQLDTTKGICTMVLEKVPLEKLYDVEQEMALQVYRRLHPGEDYSAYDLATWLEKQALGDEEAARLWTQEPVN
jgi:hypothetical protein